MADLNLNKPPLVEWLMAIGYLGGGISEWTSRLLPTVVSALAVPLLYWVWSRSVCNQTTGTAVGGGIFDAVTSGAPWPLSHARWGGDDLLSAAVAVGA